MLACVRPALQVIEVTTVDLTFIGDAGPWSWYSSFPLAEPEVRPFASPPNVAWSPWSVVIWPPPVILASQPGVLRGVHVFDAVSPGSPGSWTPLLFRSA